MEVGGDQQTGLAHAARDAIGELATQLGFSRWGICDPFTSQGELLRHWLESGAHAGMSWMERHLEARLHPECVLPDVASIIMLSYPYASSDARVELGRIARYAQGEDYHLLLKPKLNDLDECLQLYGGVQRCFSDSGPVSERFFAQQAGLGWIGKNGMLIHAEDGSYSVLCCILTTLLLPYDSPTPSRCGSCQRCLKACPTGALNGSSCDARRCLSYWTIEAQEAMPPDIAEAVAVNQRLFGCDLCQQACPWNSTRRLSNRKAPDARLVMPYKLRHLSPNALLALDAQLDAPLLHGSALRRAGITGLQKNMRLILEKQKEVKGGNEPDF